MNSKLDQPPSRAQQWLGIVLSFVATLVCGVAAVLLWITPIPGGTPVVAATLFTVLCCASVYLFYRFVRTAPRAMGYRSAMTVAWLLFLAGIVCLLLSSLPGIPTSKKLMLLTIGFSGLSYGPIAYARKRRK